MDANIVRETYPNLARFLGSALNQDWHSDFVCYTEAVTEAVKAFSRETGTKVIAELDALVHLQLTEEALRDTVSILGADFYAPGAGITYRDFLATVLSTLIAAFDNRCFKEPNSAIPSSVETKTASEVRMPTRMVKGKSKQRKKEWIDFIIKTNSGIIKRD